MLEEIQRVKQGNDYDEEMAELFRNKIRPDLDFQGYCPKCASDYPKSEALSKGCTTCEFCDSEIEYSDMLTSDFGVLLEQEKEKFGIDIPSNREPIERLILKTFLNDKSPCSVKTSKQGDFYIADLRSGRYITAVRQTSAVPVS